jgi:hypothetical protein
VFTADGTVLDTFDVESVAHYINAIAVNADETVLFMAVPKYESTPLSIAA